MARAAGDVVVGSAPLEGDALSLFSLLLFTHILGAIIAFGPSFSMPIIGAMGGREREHAGFAVRVSERIGKVQIFPLALLQGVTGVSLILVGNFDLFAGYWLLTAIVLYVIAIGYSMFVQTPTVRRIVALTSGGPPAGGPAAGAAPAGGPPPELAALIARSRQGGLLLMVLVVAIVFLMVVKPF